MGHGDGAARDKRRKQVADQAERMGVGEELRIAPASGKLIELQARPQVGEQPGLGEHDYLGVARRARAPRKRAYALRHVCQLGLLLLGQPAKHRTTPR